MSVSVPEFLSLPPKAMEMIKRFNDYRFFLTEGGRASGKTQSAGRFLLYLGEKKSLRIVCGRETQATIEESVYKVFADLIQQYNLNYTVFKSKIVHNVSGTEIIFKGFREQGSVNIKGLEGIDILWIDEAEAITKQTLDIIIPTIRKQNSRIFFSMNRNLPNDPVYDFCCGNPKCLCIHMDYFENPHVSQEILDEAERCKATSERDYRHIWLGEPLDQSSDLLFSSKDVCRMKSIEPFGDGFNPIRVIGIDFAAQGGDFCVATILDKKSPTQWKCESQIAWDETDPMVSIGRIVDLISKYNPDRTILDCGGMGYVVYSRLQELGIRIEKFDGATTKGVPAEYANARAYGYYTLYEYIHNGWIIMDSPETEKDLLNIRYEYRSNGERLIQSKEKMRKSGIHSPDRADSLMMAVYLIKTSINDTAVLDGVKPLIRKNKSRWQI